MYVKVVNYTNPKFVYFPELILNTGLKILHISLRKGSHEYTYAQCGRHPQGVLKFFFQKMSEINVVKNYV